MASHGKELSKDLRIRIVALHKVDPGYKKIGNTQLNYIQATATSQFAWPSSQKPLLKLAHKKASKQFAENNLSMSMHC